MLLEINGASLCAKTNEGESCLDLAVTYATKSHPNYALIADLRTRLGSTGALMYHHAPTRVSSNDTTCSASDGSPSSRAMGVSMANTKPTAKPRKRKRKITADDDVKTMFADDKEQANLLLSFSRQTQNEVTDVMNFASV
ncbi:MAG: hypothetical protein SGILL_000526 [Bacillariaceae sp.]